MLVLSRRVGERIVIGDDIEIVVSEIHRGVVKLAIAAPRDVPVVRGELCERSETARPSDEQEPR